MKAWLIDIIESFIRKYENDTVTKWGNPLVGFASVSSIQNLTDIVSPEHGLPQDVMDGASIVVAYYVPFLKSMADTNNKAGLASEEWAIAYEETNRMLAAINEHLIRELGKKGYRAAVHPESTRFIREELISNWSHRHIAYQAGLGTFGMNNMLITEKGCCGRYSTVITDLDVEPDVPQTEERCKFKYDGTCGACIKKCPSGALTAQGFDRYKCYEMCLKNAAVHTSFGSSYVEEGEDCVGSEVCGKCVTGMPCAFF